MKRIEQTEAKNYIKCDDDYSFKQAEFFTLTLDPTDPQWEIVTYYTSRKIDKYANREGDFDSWLYIMSNPAMPGMFKIGYSKHSPEIRKTQLSKSTSVPLPFEIEYAYHCFNAERLEQELHKYFASSRVSYDREFFQENLDTIIEAVDFLGKRYVK